MAESSQYQASLIYRQQREWENEQMILTCPKPKSIGTEQEAIAYARAMEESHKDGERWLVFKIPQHSIARQFGEYSTCRASERTAYADGGAEFVA